MRLSISVVSLGLLFGCAASPPSVAGGLEADALRWDEPIVSAHKWSAVTPSTLAASPDLAAAFSLEPIDSAAAFAPATMPPLDLGRAAEHGANDRYLMGKVGVISPQESDLDPGFIMDFAFGNYFNKFFALEAEVGYAMPDPDGSNADLFMVPMMVNARVSVPIAFVEVYGGAGFGSMYYKLEVGSFDEDGFLIAGDLFAGAQFVIRDRLTAGFELKYYITDQIDTGTDHLSGLAAMFTVGWRL